MEEKTGYNMGVRLIRPLIHFFMIICIFFFIYRLRLFTDLIPGIQLQIPGIILKETLIYAVLSGLVFVGIGIIKDFYELYKPVQKYHEKISKVWLYRLVVITFIAYFGQGFIFDSGISRFIIIVSALLTLIFVFIFDQLRNSLESKIHREGKHKILIIGTDAFDSSPIVEKIRKGFSFKSEFILFSQIENFDLTKYFMTIAVGVFSKEQLQEMFEKVRFSDTRFFHIGEGFFLENVVYSPENIDNIIAFEYKHSKLDGRFVVLKRIFDIFVSIFFIILLLPFFLIVGILIKIDSPGPIFYKQKRVGLNGKNFTFIKFRSMGKDMCVGDEYGGKQAMDYRQTLINSEANIRKGELQKIKDDPRVTRVGKFLRKFSIDELPNLFCVLIGTMSIVGPRPHLPDEIQKYKARQKRLLSIKPGITGYAQTFGRHMVSFDDEARFDLYYIQNRSIFFDIYIILATLKVIFKGRGV